LTEKGRQWAWTRAEQSAFDAMKLAITSAPVLELPEEGSEKRIEVDASDFATGGILSQKGKDGLWRPCFFISKMMSETERRYAIHDKEMLAVMRALKEWRVWLVATDVPFEIWTDHANLRYFLQPGKKLNPRQARWSLDLADYNFELKYKAGPTMGKADALSRRTDHRESVGPIDAELRMFKKEYDEPLEEASGDAPTPSTHEKRPEADDIESELGITSQMGMPEEPPLTEEEVRATGILFRTEGDDLLERLRNNRNYDDSVEKEVTSQGLKSKVWETWLGILYRNGKAVVPKDGDTRKEILRMHHDNEVSGHPGQARTRELVSRNYWWPTIRNDVDRYVSQCETCTRVKHRSGLPTGKLNPLEVPTE
jgi:hypothetical protein